MSSTRPQPATIVHDLASHVVAVRLLVESLTVAANPQQRKLLEKVTESLRFQLNLLKQLDRLVKTPPSRRVAHRG